MPARTAPLPASSRASATARAHLTLVHVPRAPEEGGVCDHACPGNLHEFCGGLVEHNDDDDDNSHLGNETRPKSLRRSSRRIVRRGIPSINLLTVYGAVGVGKNGSEPPPPQPPPMAPGSNVTNVVATATAYRTVYPLQSVASAKGSNFVVDKHSKRPTKTQRPVEVTDIATQTAFDECGCEEDENNDNKELMPVKESKTKDEPTPASAFISSTTTKTVRPPPPPPASKPVDPEIPAEQPPTPAVPSMMPDSTTVINPVVVTAAATIVRSEMRLTAALGAAVLALGIL